MDDLIYWQGVPIGCIDGRGVVWFSNATSEAIAALGFA